MQPHINASTSVTIFKYIAGLLSLSIRTSASKEVSTQTTVLKLKYAVISIARLRLENPFSDSLDRNQLGRLQLGQARDDTHVVVVHCGDGHREFADSVKRTPV